MIAVHFHSPNETRSIRPIHLELETSERLGAILLGCGEIDGADPLGPPTESAAFRLALVAKILPEGMPVAIDVGAQCFCGMNRS